MKKHNLVLIACVVLTLGACKKEAIHNSTPSYSGEMTAMVDGKAFKMPAGATYNGNTLLVYCISSGTNPGMQFTRYHGGVNKVDTFYFADPNVAVNNPGKYMSGVYYPVHGESALYGTDSASASQPSTNYFIIAKLDTAAKMISGKFSYTAKYGSNPRITVTSGTFTISKYQ